MSSKNNRLSFAPEWIAAYVAGILALPGALWMAFRGLTGVFFLKAYFPPPSPEDLLRSEAANALIPWLLLALALVAAGGALIYVYFFRELTAKGQPVRNQRSVRFCAAAFAVLLAICSVAATTMATSRIDPIRDAYE